MIDAKDLRIGNWVERNDNWSYRSDEPNKRFQWNESDWYALGECTLLLEDISPIPLTTEILEKCGFEVRDDNPKQKEHYKGDVLFQMCGFEFTNSMKDGFVCYEIFEGKVVYKYLHQLQNLYYALTQKELELKL